MADMESEGDAAGGEHPASRDAGDGTQASAPNEQIAAQQFDDASDQFVRLLTGHQLRIRAYLIAMVRTDEQADDILQETNMVLWRKRSTYDRERSFYSWACGIAFVEVMRLRRKVATEKLRFDVAILETISEDFVRQGDLLDDRKEALRTCLNQLKDVDRGLIETRYIDGESVDQLSSTVGKPAKTIYKSLARIRESLYRCIERSIGKSRSSSLRP